MELNHVSIDDVLNCVLHNLIFDEPDPAKARRMLRLIRIGLEAEQHRLDKGLNSSIQMYSKDRMVCSTVDIWLREHGLNCNDDCNDEEEEVKCSDDKDRQIQELKKVIDKSCFKHMTNYLKLMKKIQDEHWKNGDETPSVKSISLKLAEYFDENAKNQTTDSRTMVRMVNPTIKSKRLFPPL